MRRDFGCKLYDSGIGLLDQEIDRIHAAGRRLPPSGGLRTWKYDCLLRLLSLTGFRLGVALHQKLDDIDLHYDVLTIQKAKFSKSPLVPVRPSTRKRSWQ